VKRQEPLFSPIAKDPASVLGDVEGYARVFIALNADADGLKIYQITNKQKFRSAPS
jgi:hypothetical protein